MDYGGTMDKIVVVGGVNGRIGGMEVCVDQMKYDEHDLSLRNYYSDIIYLLL